MNICTYMKQKIFKYLKKKLTWEKGYLFSLFFAEKLLHILHLKKFKYSQQN